MEKRHVITPVGGLADEVCVARPGAETETIYLVGFVVQQTLNAGARVKLQVSSGGATQVERVW